MVPNLVQFSNLSLIADLCLSRVYSRYGFVWNVCNDFNLTSVLKALACFLGLSWMYSPRESPRLIQVWIYTQRNPLLQLSPLNPSSVRSLFLAPPSRKIRFLLEFLLPYHGCCMASCLEFTLRPKPGEKRGKHEDYPFIFSSPQFPFPASSG